MISDLRGPTVFRAIFFAVIIIASWPSEPAVAADDIHVLSQKATAAVVLLAQTGHMCAEVMGPEATYAGRSQIEALFRLTGLTGDDLTIAVDDADKQAAATAAKHPIRTIIGKNGVTESNVAQSCTEYLNTAMQDADVALARLRKAAGVSQ